MLTLKQLFKDKEKIKNTQITFERHQKSDNSGEMFIGLYILNGLLVLGYYIFTGKFIDASPVIIFIFPTIMMCIELMVYELYLKTKNKRKKTEESTKEEKLTKLFFDSQKEELQKSFPEKKKRGYTLNQKFEILRKTGYIELILERFDTELQYEIFSKLFDCNIDTARKIHCGTYRKTNDVNPLEFEKFLKQIKLNKI